MGSWESQTREMLRGVAHWTLPQGFNALFRRWRSDRASHQLSKVGGLVVSNAEYKGIHRGERCFVLATGPSINSQDLTVLRGQLCIAVSSFFLHPAISTVNPTYHVLAPPHPPFVAEDVGKTLTGLVNAYTSSPPTLFFGYRPYEYSLYDMAKLCPQLSRFVLRYIDYTGARQLDEDTADKESSWDICGWPFSPRTVVYIAIQVAAYMGFSEIYLLGCDHDYLTDMKRVTGHHFYREEQGVSDVAHLSAFTTERWLEEYYFRWKQYRLMRDLLALRGTRIYNATRGGMLDVFPRVCLEDILSQRNQGTKCG